jgi:hypothetical protein
MNSKSKTDKIHHKKSEQFYENSKVVSQKKITPLSPGIPTMTSNDRRSSDSKIQTNKLTMPDTSFTKTTKNSSNNNNQGVHSRTQKEEYSENDDSLDDWEEEESI